MQFGQLYSSRVGKVIICRYKTSSWLFHGYFPVSDWASRQSVHHRFLYSFRLFIQMLNYATKAMVSDFHCLISTPMSWSRDVLVLLNVLFCNQFSFIVRVSTFLITLLFLKDGYNVQISCVILWYNVEKLVKNKQVPFIYKRINFY